MRNKKQKVILAIIIIAMAVVRVWAVNFFIIEPVVGIVTGSAFEDEIDKISSKERNKLEEYDIYLPDDVEFISGRYLHGIDKSMDLKFEVKRVDVQLMLGESWDLEVEGTGHCFYQRIGATLHVEFDGEKCICSFSSW